MSYEHSTYISHIRIMGMIFVAAFHQTRIDTRSKIRGPIKVVCAAHRPTKCNVALMRQAVSRIQIWIRAHMPGYSLNKTARSSSIHMGQRLQLAHPKVAQPKSRAFQPRICHCLIPHPTRMPDGRTKRPGKYPYHGYVTAVTQAQVKYFQLSLARKLRRCTIIISQIFREASSKIFERKIFI